MKRPGRHLKQRAPKEKESRPPKRRRSGESDFPAEFDEVRSYEIREKLRPKKKPKKELSSKKAKKNPNKRKEKAINDHYEVQLDYHGWSDAGQVIAPGVWPVGAVNHTKYPEQAYLLGNRV